MKAKETKLKKQKKRRKEWKSKAILYKQKKNAILSSQNHICVDNIYGGMVFPDKQYGP